MDNPQRVLERSVLTALVVAPILSLVGFLFYSLRLGDPVAWAFWLGSGGLVLQAVVLRVTYALPHFRTIHLDESGGHKYDRTVHMTPYRVAAVFLDLMLVLAGLVLLLTFMIRLGLVAVDLSGEFSRRLLLVMAVVVGLGTVIAQYLSLRVTDELRHDWTDGTALGLTYFFAGSAILLGVAVQVQPVVLFGRPIVDPSNAPVLALIAFFVLAIGTKAVRKLPSIYGVFKEGEAPRSMAQGGRRKAVLMPTLMAFALLLLVVLLLLVYGIGFIDVVDQLASNPLLLVLLLILGAALVGALVAAQTLARSADKKTHLKPTYKQRNTMETWLLGISLSVAGLLILVGGVGRLGIGAGLITGSGSLDIITFGVLVALGPFGFYAAQQRKRILRLEERFPDFLRDIASSHRGGLTLPSSVTVAARGDYGAMTPEIQKMADQLSWNVSFDEALKQLSDRVKTPLVERAVNLILEAGHSGGNTFEVIMAAARDAREIKSIENDRRLNMSLYGVVIYVTFFVFLLIVGLLYSQFVPQILEAGGRAGEIGSGAVGGLNFGNLPTLDEYRSFYFSAAVVQGIGSGILAGMMSTGRAVMGLRHAFIMVLAAWFSFVFIF